MKKNYSFLVALLLLICGSCETKKDFIFDSTSLTMAIDNPPTTLTSMEVNDYYSSVILSQIMEGLVSIDPKDLTIKPQIASSWQISDDGLQYAFVIRKNIHFHQHNAFKSKKDRLLQPSDIGHTFERICTKGKKGEVSHAYTFLFKDNLLGAAEFFEGKADTISGMAIKDQTLTLQLKTKDANFLNKLGNICAAISSQKVYLNKNENSVIGTGPFFFSAKTKQNKLELLRNADYYEKDKDGKSLPYLDRLNFIFQTDKIAQLSLFEKHQTDLMIGIPENSIAKMFEGRIEDFNSKPPVLLMHNNPLLTTNYYSFNLTDVRFQNSKVRQAFNYALNKEALDKEVLHKQYSALGYYGIVPPISEVFKGYDYAGINKYGYTFQPEKAKKLLAEAGYPKGKKFGIVELIINNNALQAAVALEIAKQLKTCLNIEIKIIRASFEKKNKAASEAKGSLFASTWTADYANPETFLANFHGKNIPSDKGQKSTINIARYSNPIFDILFEQAKNSTKKTDAFDYYAKAEKILLQDPPFIPLWYSGDIQLVYSSVRNLHFNAMNRFIFKEVYKKEWTTAEYLHTSK